MRFEFGFVLSVYFVQKIFDESQFSGAGWAVEDDVWNLVGGDKEVEFFMDMGMNKEAMRDHSI
jgi:hypothetical protein